MVCYNFWMSLMVLSRSDISFVFVFIAIDFVQLSLNSIIHGLILVNLPTNLKMHITYLGSLLNSSRGYKDQSRTNCLDYLKVLSSLSFLDHFILYGQMRALVLVHTRGRWSWQVKSPSQIKLIVVFRIFITFQLCLRNCRANQLIKLFSLLHWPL